ncbi:MAG: CoA transferase [Chloroflexi bacterium]|nr:CoA transferase [Chloroflexota bacterium]
MNRLPLEGVRAVESSYVYAMPLAASLLTDLGAEVIKVEGLSRIDTTRGGFYGGATPDNVPGPDPWNRTSTYQQLNRGKKSLVLDLRRDEGRRVLKDLIKVSDIYIENFTPRVLRGWGMDYPNLVKIKPDLIMVSNTGYGHGEGPYSQWPAQATTMEATHGHCYVTGYRGGVPSKVGQSFVDFLSCWAALYTIALALRHRRRTGKGQWIDLSMYQMGAYWVSDYVLDWIANRRLPERIGDRHPWRAPQGCYPCAGTDQWCAISVGGDGEWSALCRVMGRPDLVDDSRFATGPGRLEHHDALDQIISEWTKGLDKLKVMELLQAAGVPAGPVFDARDVNANPHSWARGFLQKVAFPEEWHMGKRVFMGLPWRFGQEPFQIVGPAPGLGQDNHTILRQLLGYPEAEVRGLEEERIIGTVPAEPPAVPKLTLEDEVRLGRLAYYDSDYKERLGI